MCSWHSFSLPTWARPLRNTHIGRYGTPEDMAGVALFLTSPAAAHVTGAMLLLDGGQILSSGTVVDASAKL